MFPKSSLFELARALGGMPILGCLQGTPADLAGLRYGDILLSVNGARTRSFAEYIEAKDLRTDGMTAVVFRAGEEHPVELVYRPNREPVNGFSLLAELVSMRVLPGFPEESDGAS